jgi:hypothetical protein
VIATATASLAVPGIASADPAAPAPSPNSVSAPILWGDVGNTKGQIQSEESKVDRKLSVVRVYRSWDGKLGNASDIWSRDTGHRLFLSVRAFDQAGHPISWAAIGAAQPGSSLYSSMVRWAQEVKAFKAPIYLAFNHEPEASKARANGGSAQFIAAWRKWVSVFRQQGVNNATYTFTTTAYGYNRHDKYSAAAYYPGDAYVDALAVDAYNWYGCQAGSPKNWVSLQSVVEAFRQFGLRHPSKPLLLAEWGSHEDRSNPGRKAAWIRDAQALFKKPGYGQFVGLVAYSGNEDNPSCRFSFNSSAASLQAFRAMGADQRYRAGV